MRRRRATEGFNLAFLDIMACGLGAVVLVFMLVKHNVGSTTSETDLLLADMQRLQLQQEELTQTLRQLQNVAKNEVNKIVQLQAKIGKLEQSVSEKDLSLVQKKEQLAHLKKDIAARPVAQQEDLVQDDRGGEENYLMGLKVEGGRIAILLDSSASMTDESLIDIIKRKNSPEKIKKKGPKWLRAKKTVRWLLARVPKTSQLTVISYNASVRSLVSSGWIKVDNSAKLQDLYKQLDTIVPTGATNLQKGLKAVAQQGVTDLYLITDGLPTVGDSRYTSLNPFAGCNSLLGRSSTISGECRVKLFRQTIKDSSPGGVKIHVILLPIEGDPDAVNEYWGWAAQSGGLVISPAVNWP